MLTDKHVQYARKDNEQICFLFFYLINEKMVLAGLEHATFKHVTMLEHDVASRTNDAFIFNF